MWVNYPVLSKREITLIVMKNEIFRINKLKELENWISQKFQVRVTLKFYGTWEIDRDESVLLVRG